MQHFTSTQAKQNFGDLLKAAEQGPVAVERHKRVQVIVATPQHFANSQQQAGLKAERKLARMRQSLVDRDRLIRHQRIAIALLTRSKPETTKLIKQAQAMVACWRDKGLCSDDYIDRWSTILAMPVSQMAQAIVSDADGWGEALRQNSPWVGELA